MLDNLIDCNDPMYGKTGVFLLASTAVMKVSNEWIPGIEEISDGVLLCTSILAGVLLFFKIRSIRKLSKKTDLDIIEKDLQLRDKYGEDYESIRD